MLFPVNLSSHLPAGVARNVEQMAAYHVSTGLAVLPVIITFYVSNCCHFVCILRKL